MLAVVWRLLCSILLAVSAMDVAYSWASVASALMATAGCCDGVLATATPERAEASWCRNSSRRVASSFFTYQNKSINAESCPVLLGAVEGSARVRRTFASDQAICYTGQWLLPPPQTHLLLPPPPPFHSIYLPNLAIATSFRDRIR